MKPNRMDSMLLQVKMKEISDMIKWTLTIILTVIFSVLHIRGSGTELVGHLLHQQLFFIPIILASFWFHLRAGLIVAVIISVIYITSMQAHMTSPDMKITLLSQVSLYLFIAALIGWLATRLDNQQKQVIKDEKNRSVITLVFALSHEILGIINALELKYSKSQTPSNRDGNQDFQEEISKLKQLTRAFQQFDQPERDDLISQDLNEELKKSQKKFQQKAKQAHIRVLTDLDEAGCPTMLLDDAVTRLIEALIDNAIEASPEKSEIVIRSKRKGTHCLVEVIDSGYGVSEADMSRLFTPFFTTKPDGHGLSLAAGKKIMKDREGDLLYERRKNGGSVFRLILPRENIDKNINEHISEKVLH